MTYKLKDILNELLLEMATDVVYHSTMINDAIKILKGNEFKLATSVGTHADNKLNKKYPYYLSTARSRDSSYYTHSTGENHVIMKLDGQKLNQKVKAEPVDYWGRDTFGQSNLRDEMEDRFMSKKQILKDAKDYILQMDVYLPIDKKYLDAFDKLGMRNTGMTDDDINKIIDDSIKFSPNEKESRWIRELLLLSKRYKIPTYFYIHKEAFQFGETHRAIKLPLDKLKTEPNKDHWYDYGSRISYSPIKQVLEMYYKNELSELDQKTIERGRRTFWRLDSSNQYYNDFITVISNEIHNDKRGNNRYVNRVVKLIIKHGGTVKSFVEYLSKKWYDKIFAEGVGYGLKEQMKLMSIFNELKIKGFDPEKDNSDDTPHHVDTWYDKYTRSWVVQLKGESNDQIGDAIYVHSKREAKMESDRLKKQFNVK